MEVGHLLHLQQGVEVFNLHFWVGVEAFYLSYLIYQYLKILKPSKYHLNIFFLFSSGEKLVLKVAKRKSDPILAFAQLGPTYMSSNVDTGERDCSHFFPENYEDEDAEIAPLQPRHTTFIEDTIGEDQEEMIFEGVLHGEEEEDLGDLGGEVEDIPPMEMSELPQVEDEEEGEEGEGQDKATSPPPPSMSTSKMKVKSTTSKLNAKITASRMQYTQEAPPPPPVIPEGGEATEGEEGEGPPPPPPEGETTEAPPPPPPPEGEGDAPPPPPRTEEAPAPEEPPPEAPPPEEPKNEEEEEGD